MAEVSQLLYKMGPSNGHFTAAAKSFAICPKQAEAPSKPILDAARLPVKWSKGQCYVGGFIRSGKVNQRWQNSSVQKWVVGMDSLSKVAKMK